MIHFIVTVVVLDDEHRISRIIFVKINVVRPNSHLLGVLPRRMQRLA